MKTALVTGGTRNVFSAMAVMVMNIADVFPNIADELIIFHDGVSKKQQNKVNQIFPTRFIEYKSPFDNVTNFTSEVTQLFSSMVFCKYECFKLLEEYDRVIWLDYDIVIQKKFDIPETTAFLFDEESDVKYSFKKDLPQDTYSTYDFTKHGVYMAYFVVTRDIKNYMEVYNWCLEQTCKFAKYLYLPEQAIVNLALQKFNIQHLQVNNTDCRFMEHPNKILEKMDEYSILHCYGNPKFWNGLENKQWQNYYNIWISKYKGIKYRKTSLFKRVINKLKRIVKK